MTIYNDLCDFCGAYCDPIGCDTKQRLGLDGTMWDGQCEAGLIFKWRLVSDAQLEDYRQKTQAAVDASVLDWDNRGTDGPAWVRWVHQQDQLYDIVREQKRRAGVMKTLGRMLVAGHTLWDRDDPSWK